MSTFLGMPAYAPRGVGQLRAEEPFPAGARRALSDTQLRRNIRHATHTIRAKRATVVDEVRDWEALRVAGQQIKAATMARLDEHLEKFECELTARGGVVHWARDANEANDIVTALGKETGETDVVKVKSMVTQEMGLNEALADADITAYETDLAELIVHLGHDRPSHILVPAIHRNRAEIRDIFLREMGNAGLAAPPDLIDDPRQLAMAARAHLRALLEDRLLDYQAAVRRTDEQGLPQAIAAVLAEAGAGGGPVLLPGGLPRELLPQGQADRAEIGARELEGFAAVVTACVVACAETGTIVLDGSPDQGRRAITLVPDVRSCPTYTSASFATIRSSRRCQRCLPGVIRRVRSRSSAALPRRATSNSIALKASTARARSRSSSSPASCARGRARRPWTGGHEAVDAEGSLPAMLRSSDRERSRSRGNGCLGRA